MHAGSDGHLCGQQWQFGNVRMQSFTKGTPRGAMKSTVLFPGSVQFQSHGSRTERTESLSVHSE